MKIVDAKTNNGVPFEQIADGRCFDFQGKYYMKIWSSQEYLDEDNTEPNIVRLATGELGHLYYEDLVIPVEIEARVI